MFNIQEKLYSLPLQDDCTMYFNFNNCINFAQIIDSKAVFMLLREDVKSKQQLIKLKVYIENDTLMFNLGNMLQEFDFGLNDRFLVMKNFISEDFIRFYFVYKEGNTLDYCLGEYKLTERHKYVINEFINNTYSREINLKDKYGEDYPFSTEKEAKISFLIDELNEKNIGGNSGQINKYIREKYNLTSKDLQNKEKMNEILEYVLKRYIIMINPLGFCVHDKNEKRSCVNDCSGCAGCSV